MKKILVTGGAGFIGSHLCEELLKQENKVVSVDNYLSGSKKNIRHLMKNPSFKAIKHDIVNPLNLECDEIYNLACPASPAHYQSDPIKTIKANTNGMINMLELALKNKARILQASTSEVYGDPLEHPQKESYWGNVNPVGLRSCYDEGKRVAETLCMDYHRQNKVDVRIVRIFNTYGPRMALNDGRVVPNFIAQALKNEPITVYGTGKQTRSFCFVSDLVNGLIKMMASKITGPVNLGNPNEITVLELAEKIIKLTGSKSEIVFKALPSDDPHKRKPDISLAEKELKWKPKVSLEEGLEKTIDYFKKVLE